MYHSSKGVRCSERAVLRLQFALSHPFDFTDVCQEHLKEYANSAWSHELREDWNANIRKIEQNNGHTTQIFGSVDQTKESGSDQGKRQSVSREAEDEKVLSSITIGIPAPSEA